jgi:hypothetical protein
VTYADRDGRVAATVTRLIAQRELIPVVVAADTPSRSPDVQPPAAVPEPRTQWDRIVRLIGAEGRAIVIAPESWRAEAPQDVTQSVLRIMPAASPA